MTLQLVPRSVRAIADQLNSYYRVLRGIDADSLLLRLSTGGAFEVRHSVTNTPVLRVTDAGATVSVGDATVTNAKLAPNAVTSDKILDGTIVDLDISASADIDAAKLRAGTVGASQIGTGQLYSFHFVDNQILAARLFVVPGAGGVFRATSGPPVTFGLIQGSDIGPGVIGTSHLGNNIITTNHIVDGTIANADVNAAAAIAYSKLALTNSIKSTDIADDAIMNVDVNPNAAIGLAKVAHVGSGNVLRSDGSANVGGQVVNADIAAAANINGAKMLDNSIPASKMLGGVSIPNDSVTSAHIADDTIVNADVNSAAAIALAKLAHVGSGNVLRSNGSANVGGQVVNADVAAGAAIAYAKLALGGALLNADVNAGAAIAYSKLSLNNQITSADIKDDAIVNADVNPTANIGLAKLAHVGSGNVLRSNGTTNAAGQIGDGEVAAGAGIAVTKLGIVPAVMVTRTGAQSFADGALGPVSWDSETYDAEGMHDNVTNNTRLTAITPGVYQVNMTIWWDVGTTGWRYASIRYAGAAIGNSRFTGIVGNYTEQSAGALVRLGAGEFVEVYVSHINGTALNVMAGSRFSMARVGA